MEFRWDAPFARHRCKPLGERRRGVTSRVNGRLTRASAAPVPLRSWSNEIRRNSSGELEGRFDFAKSRGDAFHIASNVDTESLREGVNLLEDVHGEVDGPGEHVFGMQKFAPERCRDIDTEPVLKSQGLLRATGAEGEQELGLGGVGLLKSQLQGSQKRLRRRR